jgi:hypothetical protein
VGVGAVKNISALPPAEIFFIAANHTVANVN